MNKTLLRVTVLSAFVFGSCRPAQDDAVEASSSSAALHGIERNLYLQCDSTGWSLNEDSQLEHEAHGGEWTRRVDVAKDERGKTTDACILTELRGHGDRAVRRIYSTRATVDVPGDVKLSRARLARPFLIRYPEPGTYRVAVSEQGHHLSVEAQPSEPSTTVFSPSVPFGDRTSYEEHTPSRWSVGAEDGDTRYLLDRSDYAEAGGGLLGEASLLVRLTYADFVLRLVAHTKEDLSSNPAADFAVVYGYLDRDNYSFMSFSARASETQLFRVTGGHRELVATANAPGISDAGYHAIELWRHGSWIRVAVDGTAIVSVNEPDTQGGRIGVGSFDDAASFDDIQVSDYAALRTPNFFLSLPSDQREYEDSVSSLLETAYAVYLENTGWDVNQRMGHVAYDYYYRPQGWMWFNDAFGCCELGGGLTVGGGPSVVNSVFIPESRQSAADVNVFLAITMHELGNGWALPGVTTPEWVEWLRSESHSGFLRAEGELDMGYCADANREHAAHYADYLATSPEDRRSRGSNVEPLLVSLVERYGWRPFRKLYDAAQAGELDYLATLRSEERDDAMVLFLSRQIEENLSAFFARELGIRVSSDVSSALEGLPDSDLVVLAALACHPPKIRVTPAVVEVVANPALPIPPATVYVQAPVAWTVRRGAGADWLEVTRNGASDATTLTLEANVPDRAPGLTLTSELVFESDALPDGSIRVPVSFRF
jgi:hypothetical protein